MSRPPPGPALLLALSLGLASGAVEVALRTSPQLGLSSAALWTWYGASLGISAAFSLIVAIVCLAAGRAAHAGPLMALLWVHAALAWRFDVVVNAFAREARVWAPLLALSAGALLGALRLEGVVHRRLRGFGALALLALLSGLAAGPLRTAPAPLAAKPSAAEARPNVVLVTIDTARADRFSAYGAQNPTPTLDAVAAGGALFEAAFATAPLTQPSHLAVLTGNPPYVTGVVTNGTELGPQPAMLPAALRASGYRTAAFVAGFPLHGRFGWGQAFDVYDDDFGAVAGLHRLSLVKALDQVLLPSHALRERRGDLVLNRALPWLEANAGAPFFLWVHLFDVHGPYEAPDHPFDPPTDGPPLDLPPYWPPRDRAITSTDWLISAYDAELRYADAQVGRLVDRLASLGLSDRTLLVITADHGESLTEHGYLFDHGDDLFDPSLRVPLVMRFPGRISAGARPACQVSNEDVTPTVLSLLGVEDGLSRVGADRSAALQGGPCVEAPLIATTVGARFTETPPIDHALRAEGHKLISLAPRADQAAGTEQLYDLSADPGEIRPIPEGQGPAAAMRAQLDAALQGGGQVQEAQSDMETVEALRALGYTE